MIRNYFKIAWRNIVKQKLFSLINIGGLAVGLAVCMMIMLYVAHEMSYDRFHKNGDCIFLPQISAKVNGTTLSMDYTSFSSGPYIKNSLPVVSDYMRTLKYFKPVIVNSSLTPQNKLADQDMLFADSNFFSFFSFKLISGQPGHVLDKPFSLVLSENTAKKYFGNTDPVGKTITIKTDTDHVYQVTGVAENSPSNSSITFNFVASNASLLATKEAKMFTGGDQYTAGSYSTYLLVKNIADTASLHRSLQSLVQKQGKINPFPNEISSLSPFIDTHLSNNWGDTSNLKYLKIFPLVAALILILALVNYMSLSTARATLRAKEVGVRKVSGASRRSLATQFYIESALFALISFALGFGLFYALKPWFLNVLQLNIDNSFLYSPLILTLLFGLLVLTIVVAGSYPSLVLSAFNPVVTLKGKMSKKAGGVTVRKIFTTLQFSISVCLIICGIIIDRQLYFFRHADIGIDKDNVVMIPVANTMGKNYASFKADVENLAGISTVATSHYGMFQGYDMYQMEAKDNGTKVMLPAMTVGDSFIKTLGLKWAIPPQPGISITGKDKVVLNELAVEKLHLPSNPIGLKLKSGPNETEIVGVLKNFHFNSMEYKESPVGLFLAPDTTSFWSKVGCNLFAKIKPHTNVPTTLENIQSVYKKYDAETPFSYTFMDDAFNAQYKAEDRLASIFSIFTIITVMLATLGLFGLAAFTIEQRTKEIGIRKVLGASVRSLFGLLSSEFLVLVAIALCIALPIAWYSMHMWLQGFAYRQNIQWWVLVLTGLGAVIIAFITISFQSVKAAMANPVDSLRGE